MTDCGSVCYKGFGSVPPDFESHGVRKDAVQHPGLVAVATPGKGWPSQSTPGGIDKESTLSNDSYISWVLVLAGRNTV